LDLSNGLFGIFVASPTTPMVQLGDFTFGKNQQRFSLARGLLLGWATNNYWETNFRAHQPGLVETHYRFLPYSGEFLEQDAHRFGAEAAMPLLVQHLGEPPVAGALLPRQGTFLKLPAAPLLTLGIVPDDHGTELVLYLLNASDTVAEASIDSGLLRIMRVRRCDLLGNLQEDLPVHQGKVTFTVAARRIARLLVEVARAL
jgi:hypothetical protein